MATAPDRERRSLADQADYAAGLAFQGGDYVKAGQLLAAARSADPARAELWASRLARVEEAAAVKALAKAGLTKAGPAETSRPEPSPLPEPGVHRDGGTTTVGRFGRFGRFERAPDPGPGHYCPGCTTYTERDGKTYVHVPQIEEHQAECQACGVLRSMGRAIQREPEHHQQAEAAS
jgi:hypothetical protein